MGNKNKTKTNRVDALRCDKWFYSPTEDGEELATLCTDSDTDRYLDTPYDYDYAYDTYMEEFEWDLYQLWYKLSCQKSGEEQTILRPGIRWSIRFPPEVEAELNELLIEMPLSYVDFKSICSSCTTFYSTWRHGTNGGGNTRFNSLPARFGCITSVSSKASIQKQKGVTRHNREPREASDSIDYPWFAKAVAKLGQDVHEEYEAYLNSPDPTCKGEIRATDPFAPSYLEWRDERFKVGMNLLRTKLARGKRLAATQCPAVSLTNQFDKLKSNNRI